MGEQGGHGAAERDVQQDQLMGRQGEFQQRIQERENELQDLRRAVWSLQAAMEDTDSIIIMLIDSIKRRGSERGANQPLEQEDIQLLENLRPELDESSGAVRNFIDGLKAQLGICKTELFILFRTVENIHGEEPVTREDFLRYSFELTLDPNTAHKYLHLPEGNREVTRVKARQAYPDHNDRFLHRAQVLCKEGLSERCYWEVEWSGHMPSIAVTYRNISRAGRGDDCRLGRNNKSWSLCCAPARYTLWHNKDSTKISIPSSSTIGVYLDHGAGTLSFYCVSDIMILLHRVQTTFTQPLYPGFIVGYYGSSVKLCDLG